uniref:5'-AMP-activated protein kinase subunit beta-1 n=1 Tax=Mesocestoides corti TaxID=53468 RepID=A0A5K3F1Z3_MESCO
MMGNTPLHSKRRLSGDAETIACDNTPPHIIMDIPSKRPTLSEHQDSPRSAPIGTGYDRADVDNMAWLFHGASLHDAEHSPHSVCVSSGRPTSLPVPSSAHELPTGGYMDTSGDSRELRSCSGNDGDTLPSDVEMTTSTPQKHLLPTVFRWNGGGHEIYVSGTFNNWQKRIPMARRKSGHVVIVDCPPGRHEYKFFIDGAWYHDPTKVVGLLSPWQFLCFTVFEEKTNLVDFAEILKEVRLQNQYLLTNYETGGNVMWKELDLMDVLAHATLSVT